MTAKTDGPADEPPKHAAEKCDSAPENAIVAGPFIELGHDDLAEPLEGNPEVPGEGVAERIGSEPGSVEQLFTDDGMPKTAGVVKESTGVGDGEDGNDEERSADFG